MTQLIFLVCTTTKANVFELGKRHFQSLNNDMDSNVSRTITEIISDNQGFLWLGTYNGLVRYDGYQFKVYFYDAEDPNTIGGNHIRSIWVAKDNKIWVGTMSGGLSAYDPKTDQFTRYVYDKDNSNSISHNRVEAVVGDNQGGIWIGTNAGLNFLNLKTNKITHHTTDTSDITGLNDNHIRSLLIDHNADLWIGSWKGLNKLKKGGKVFEAVHSNISQENNLSDKNISVIFEDHENKIWLGTARSGAAWIDKNNKLNFIPAEPGNQNKIQHPWVDGIIQANVNEIWLATYGGGIAVIDLYTGKVKENIRHDPSIDSSINLDSLGAIWQDASGIIWVGTWGSGLNKLTANNAIRTFKNSTYFKPSLGNYDLISLLILQNGEVWLGSSSNGIGVLEPKLGTVTPLKDIIQVPNLLIDSTISSMEQSQDGIIWIGSQQSGLFKYFPKTQSFKQFSSQHGLTSLSVRVIHFESKTKYWIGTDKGIFLFDPEKESFQYIKKIKNSDKEFVEPIVDLQVDQNGVVWIATDNGLHYLPKNQQEIMTVKVDLNSPQKLNHHNIRTLYLDEQQTLWITTLLGLTRLIGMKNGEPVFEQVGNKNILLTSIQPDNQGRLWSVEGVYDPSTNLWSQINLNDGMDILSWFGSHDKENDGTLLFGGTNGLLLIKPDKFEPWNYEPATVITDIKLNGVSQKEQFFDKLTISSDIKSFSIEFATLDYSAPQSNQYAYWLEGYDSEWIKTDSRYRIASYTNIDPGHYVLKIKGTNRLGIWSQKKLAIPIAILPTWYQTSWFKFLVFIATGSLLYFVYVIRVKHLQDKKTELSLEVQARTYELLIMGKIGRELNSLLDQKSIFEALYKHITRIVDTHVFAIGLVDKQKKHIVFELGYEGNKAMPRLSVSLSENEKCSVWCVNHSNEIFMKNKSEISHYIQGVAQATAGDLMESVIYIPLSTRENHVIGCMTIQSPKQNAYSVEQREIFRTLASYTAIAIDNAMSYEKVENTNKALKEAYKKLQEISSTDHLTGLKNRRYLTEQIGNDTAKSVRDYVSYKKNKKPYPIDSDIIFYLLDLDHFKRVNDIYGHSAGDFVLVEVKGLLEKVFRTSDYLVRWGGEEFLIVARFADRQLAHTLAERLRVLIEQHDFHIDAENTIKITGSIGFACFPIKTNAPKEYSWLQTVDIADKCLYAAKKTSRNAWVGIDVTQEGQTVEIQKSFLKSPQDLVEYQHVKVFSSCKTEQKLVWE
ncbi:diguanylate cyclase [Aliikangiella sp. IMCC44359]|uniref:diguanylate cyclase n=1 Tax=Aliikangiella sp. IMCC44359 TaxID=3459125 RepID=UPI00403AA3F4